MNNNKLIAEALLEIAKRSKTTFLEVGKEDKELIDAAKKIGIELPSPDLMVMKTIYCEIDKVNLNGVILPRKAIEKGLNTLIGKQCNWEHNGSGFVCGYTISAKINKDEVEEINVLFKSLFPDKTEELKDKVKSGEAAVSFEIWNKNPDTGKSVVKELDNGFKEITPIIFHGTGILLINKPACPTAKIFKLIATKEIEEAEKIVERVFSEDLIYASLALENMEEAIYECECLKCGKIISSDKHCKDIKCPECGGEMRRKDRPGKGQPNEKSKKEENKVELEELYANVLKEEDITFEIAMAFYYASEEDKAKLTEDAAKWTRKFINSLPDSAFAAIEPAYPEKTEDKNARHLPHHNGEGDLGKEKSNANLDLPHYKNALARVNQIKPITDSISAEDLQSKANNHLERHKDALEKSSEETKTEEKATETKPIEGDETKVEEPKVEETKEVKAEVKPEETPKVEAETKVEEPKVEEKTEEKKEEVAEEKKEEAQPLEVVEPKIIVKVTRIYNEVSTDTYVDGTPSGTQEVKGYTKKITEYKDGTKDEIEEEVKIEKKFTFAEVEEKINAIKAEKDIEINNLKEELGKKNQEIAELKTPKVEEEINEDLNVGSVEERNALKEIQRGINKKAFPQPDNKR